MTHDLSTEKTTVVAIFSNRGDAELAQGFLGEQDIEVFISADDLGGMYPNLQQTHGVKLIGHVKDAPEVQKRLEEAGLLLPEEVTEESSIVAEVRDAQEKQLWTDVIAIVFIIVVIAIILMFIAMG